VTVDPQAQTLLEALVAAGRPSSMSLPLADGRRNFAELFASLAGPPEEVERVEDLRAPGPAGEVAVRMYRPRAESTDPGPDADRTRPAVAFFHGGGWVFGDIDTEDGLCRSLANASGAVVASVGYRRAPEHPFPAPLEDCLAAVRWLRASAADLGVDRDRLAVAGASSGGTLAAATALRARDEGGPALRYQVLLYPALDPRMATGSYAEHAEDPFLSRDEMAWYWDRYLGSDPGARSDPSAAPALAANLRGLPPGLIVTAENDPLRDEAEGYAERLNAAGVPTTLVRVAGMVHGFVSMDRSLDAARDTVALVGSAVSAALAQREVRDR
jgi:acetyl esterase